MEPLRKSPRKSAAAQSPQKRARIQLFKDNDSSNSISTTPPRKTRYPATPKSGSKEDTSKPILTPKRVKQLALPDSPESRTSGDTSKSNVTPKRVKQLTSNADSPESCSSRTNGTSEVPRTPTAKSRGANAATPKSVGSVKFNLTPKRVRELASTPEAPRTSSRSNPGTPSTPYNLRRRIQKQFEKALEESDLSDSESDYNPSDSESESEVSEQELEEDDPFPVSTPKRTRKRNVHDGDDSEDIESYFSAQGKQHTSSHTLGRLRNPQLSRATVHSAVSSRVADHAAQRKELTQEHLESFSKWMVMLNEGYNLILYGLGSKRNVLDAFRAKMCSAYDVIVVDGCFPSLSIKQVLDNISEEFLGHDGSFGTTLEQATFIAKHVTIPLVLLVHNMDGPALKDEGAQMAFATLASVRNILLIASIDHVNAKLLWDHNKLSRMCVKWVDATTFAPYLDETAFEDMILLNQNNTLALSSLTHVFCSLTPNTKKIFLLILRHQMENPSDLSCPGIAFSELYQSCREAFLVNSDLTLRAQLTEFKDHKLIKMKKGADGMEYLVVPLSEKTIAEFLEKQSNE